MSAANGRERESHERVENVVLVVLDTARTAAHGGRHPDRESVRFDCVDEATTPTLYELAVEGTTYDRAFATAPWTLPSHASVFTGRYPSEHGTHGESPVLDESMRTLPEAFADAGYETVGVSNNTWITEEFGFDRGFDELRRGWQYVQSDVDMGTVVRGEDRAEKLAAVRDRLFEGNPLVNAANVLYSEFLQPAGDDGADRTTRWIADWLDGRDDERPFFLFCNYIEPHVEYDPPRAYADRFLPADVGYDEATSIRQDPRAFDCEAYAISEREFAALRGLYRGELAYVDAKLARLRAALERAGEWEDTLFVVCGDHGEHVGERGFFGHQYNLYDALVQVPLILHGGPFAGGSRRTDLVQLLDVPDTLLAAAGIDDGLTERSRGRALSPAGTGAPREAVFAEYVAPQPSIERLEARFGEVPDRVRRFDRRLRMVRTPEYKYVRGDDGFERLHDLRADPDERVDRSADDPETVAAMRRRLDRRFGDLDATPEPAEPVAMREGTRERLADLGYL